MCLWSNPWGKCTGEHDREDAFITGSKHLLTEVTDQPLNSSWAALRSSCTCSSSSRFSSSFPSCSSSPKAIFSQTHKEEKFLFSPPLFFCESQALERRWVMKRERKRRRRTRLISMWKKPLKPIKLFRGTRSNGAALLMVTPGNKIPHTR